MAFSSTTYGYTPARRPCSGRTQPGTRALYDYIRLRWPATRDTGTYNCRNVGGTSAPSKHGNGEAGDNGNPIIRVNGRDTYDKATGWEIANWLVANAIPLGIQRVIHDHKEWDSRDASQRQWNDYYGQSNHEDHVHWEQHTTAAVNLTIEDIARLEGHPMDGFTKQQQDEMYLVVLNATNNTTDSRTARVIQDLYDKAIRPAGGWANLAAHFSTDLDDFVDSLAPLIATELAPLITDDTPSPEALATALRQALASLGTGT